MNIIQSENQIPTYCTPCKFDQQKIVQQQQLNQQQDFYTPINKQLFTAKKNISASKFYIDEQSDHQQIEQVQIDLAIQKIKQNYENYEQLSIVTQDVIKLIYLFQEIKMLCIYPLEIQFLSISHQAYPNNISLILSTNKIKDIEHIVDITQLSNKRNGLINITYNQLYRRGIILEIYNSLDSDCVLEFVRRMNIKQIFYMPNLDQCRYLLCPDIIPQHIVCSNSIMPISTSHQLRNFLQLRTDYLGPSLDVGITQQEEYCPNYKLNRVIFMEKESDSKLLFNIKQYDLQNYALKFRNQNSIQKFEDYCLNQDIYLKGQITYDTSQLIKDNVEVLIHVDQLYSLQEYLNDCAFINKNCISIIYLNKEQYLKKRKSLYFQQTDTQFLTKIYQYLQSNNLIQLTDIRDKFHIDNVNQLLILLEKHNLISIQQYTPTLCQLTLDFMADTNSERINEILKIIKLNSRRIISLRKEAATIKHFQVNLKAAAKKLQLDLVDLCIQIEKLDSIFLNPEFSEYQVSYQVMENDTNTIASMLEKCANAITNIRQRQIEELDIFYCLGQMIKSHSLSRCQRFHSNQDTFAKFIDKYFTSETQLSIGELFNYNHQKYLPIRDIEGIREKSQIMSDIRRLHNLDPRDMMIKLMDQHITINPNQLSELICDHSQQQKIQGTRVQGWILKKIKQ